MRFVMVRRLSCALVCLLVAAMPSVATPASASAAPALAPVRVDTTPPPIPSGLRAVSGDASAYLSWIAPRSSRARDLAGYRLYRSTTGRASGQWTRVDSDPLSATTYTDRGLTNGARVYYAVTSVDRTGNESARSRAVAVTPAPDRTPPPIPSGLRGRDGTAGVSLSWSAARSARAPDLAGYRLYSSPSGRSSSTWTRLNETPHSLTRYLAARRPGGTRTYYAVTSVDTSGNESARSRSAAVTSRGPAADTTPPAVPTGLTATPGVGTASLAWSAVPDSDLAGYRVYRSYRGGDWHEVTSAAQTGLTFTDHSASTTGFDYAVTAVDTSGNESARSASAYAQGQAPPDTTAPAVPTDLDATPGDGTVDLAWGEVGDPDLAGYHVYRSLNGFNAWEKLTGAVPQIARSYRDAGLTNGFQYYYYAVTAVDRSGNESARSIGYGVSPAAPPDTTAPAVPTGLMATPGVGTASLAWSAVPDADLAGYRVYRSHRGGGWRAVTAAPQTGLTFTDYSASTTGFDYAVTAVDTSGNESARSASAYAQGQAPPDTTAPAVPTGLTATAGDETVDLAWGAVSAFDLVGYKVYVSPNGEAPWTLITASPVASTSFQSSDLVNFARYYYAVSAIDRSGNESGLSSTVSAVPEPEPAPVDGRLAALVVEKHFTPAATSRDGDIIPDNSAP